MSPATRIDASALANRHPALSPGIAHAGAEACAVALSRHHESPTSVDVDDASRAVDLVVSWEAPDAALRQAWRDAPRATENGAEMLALVTLDASRRLVAVDRALRGSRVDYYLGAPGTGLEHAVALEIGGIDGGSITSLLAKKRRQASQNADRLPAVAVAVRFTEPRVMIRDVEKTS